MAKRGASNHIAFTGVYDGRPEDFGNPDRMQSYIIELDELERVVHAVKGRTIFIAVRHQPRARDQSEADANTHIVYKAYGYIVVSKRVGLRFLKDAYDTKLRAVARAHMSISSTCLFIG